MELKNLMENVVWYSLDEVLAEMPDVCSCDQCRFDIAAITLNNLKPKYVVTDRGYVFAKANSMTQQFNTDVVAAVTNAINIVGKNPRHRNT